MLNQARTIFSGGGGGVKRLLTAIVVAVLLAAPAGTAEAQSVSFSATTGVVKEPPPGGAAPPPFTVTVTRSADTVTPVTFTTTPALTSANYGDITVTCTPTCTGNTIDFTRNQAVLSFAQAADPNWKDEKFIIALRAPAGTDIGPELTITVDDHEDTPSILFSPPNDPQEMPAGPIRLTEQSVWDYWMLIRIWPPQPIAEAILPNSVLTGLNDAMADRVRISVDPPDALGKTIKLTHQDGTPETIGASHAVANKPGQYDLPVTVDKLVEYPRMADIRFSVEALADTTGFRSPRVTLTALPLDKGANGTILGGPPFVIEVLSDEAIPTVYFSPTDISIKEGGRTTAALVSEGKQGAEVNTVMLAVDGDALVDLYQGSAKLAPKDGVITVDLKDTNVARLSARSTSDRSLLDGQLKKKTWRITDADGANIDTDANWFTVTVEGSTAVPALPLVAQLLLALFLTAGGARLYRRRG